MQSKVNYRALDQRILGPKEINLTTVTGPQGLVEEYLMWKGTYRKRAAKAYRVWVERFQNFVEKTPEELTLSDLTLFITTMQQIYAPKNIEYGMSIIHNYLKFWKEQGRLYLPLYVVRVPRARANSHNAITEQEYQQMLDVLRKPDLIHLRNQAIIRLLHDTGMRVGELCALNVEDIKDESAIIRTEKTIHSRIVFWTTETGQVVKKYIKARGKVCKDACETNALFIGLSKNSTARLTSRSVQRFVKEIINLAKIDRVISPHSFRHGFIHRLARKRVPDAVIACLVGHSTPTTIAEYTKLSRPETREAYLISFEETIRGVGEMWPQARTTALA